MNIYQAKVAYVSNSSLGATTETYLVEAHNLTEVEALITKAVMPQAVEGQPIEVKSIVKKKFEGVLRSETRKDDHVRYYIIKIEDKDENDVVRKYTYLARASCLGEAHMMTDVSIRHNRIISIVETDILDFIEDDKDE